MKRMLLLFAFFSLCQTNAQSFEKLKSDARKIYDANYTMDFDAVTALTYPKIIESLGGKTAFTDKLDTDYQNDEFRMRLQIVDPVFSYSEMKKAEGKTFYIITYKNPIRYFFEKKLDADTASKKVTQLKESAQANEVIFEPKRNSFNVKRNSRLVAVSDESTNGEWRFFNFDDVQQRNLFETIFGGNVKKELGL